MRFKKHISSFFISALSFFLSVVILLNHAGFSLSELNEHVIGVETCNPESEKNACHRYVYHHEESRDCDGSHKHVSASDSECFGCKYFKQHQSAILTADNLKVNLLPEPVSHDNLSSPLFLSSPFLFYLRGPPVLS